MSNDPSVRLSRAFCSARDRNIPVLVQISPDSTTARGPAAAPALVSCLDYGVRCTGWLCPLFSVPTLPPEELLEEAIVAERRRKARSVAQGRAILERALKEGRLRRTRDRRRAPEETPESQPRG
jgi:hypothetical protein